MSDDLQKQMLEAQQKAFEMQQQMAMNAQNQALEMQRAMMKAQGLSDEQINQYLGQSVASMQATQEHMMAYNEQVMHYMTGGADEEKAEFISQHPQPEAYARYLALGSFFMNMQDEPVETLELMDEDIDDCKEEIMDSWGINNHESAVEMIESLLNGRSYNVVNNTWLQLKAGKRDGIDDDDLANYLATVESLQESLEVSKEQIAECPSTYAWDIERAAFLARVCTHMGYITTDEAWSYLQRAGKVTKEHFTNWRDYGMSIVLGRAFTMGYHDNYFYALEEMLIDEPEFLNSIDINTF